MEKLLHSEITSEIIGAGCEVWRVLGYEFLEKVYENALVAELRRRGLNVQQQVAIDVIYKSEVVGQYIADLVVNNAVLIELNAEKELQFQHEAQLLNYLKATNLRVGMLMNFGQAGCKWKRLVF